MKKHLLARAALTLLALILFSAAAEGSDCWYYAQNGQHDFEQTDFCYATCTEDGYYILECRQCGLNKKEITMAAEGHSWKVNKKVGASCAKEGYEERECSVCGEEETRKLKKTGHAYGSWEVIIPATSSSMGMRAASCANCGNRVEEDFYPDGTLFRGTDDSDGVLELQLMLSDCGYLNDTIDGKFGKNTEGAVKAFQRANALEADGIAWPQTIELLDAEWARMNGLYPEENDSSSVCNIWQDENGNTIYELCGEHRLLYKDAFSMLEDDYAESHLYSYLSCQNEILRLYDQWIERLPENAREGVAANRALCLSFMEAQRSSMRASYDALGVEAAPADVEFGMEYWMQAHTAWLCLNLHMIGGGI